MRRRSGGTTWAGEEISSLSIAMVPAEGGAKPAIMRSVVVLPQPDGPSSETNSPGAISSEKSATASTAP